MWGDVNSDANELVRSFDREDSARRLTTKLRSELSDKEELHLLATKRLNSKVRDLESELVESDNNARSWQALSRDLQSQIIQAEGAITSEKKKYREIRTKYSSLKRKYQSVSAANSGANNVSSHINHASQGIIENGSAMTSIASSRDHRKQVEKLEKRISQLTMEIHAAHTTVKPACRNPSVEQQYENCLMKRSLHRLGYFVIRRQQERKLAKVSLLASHLDAKNLMRKYFGRFYLHHSNKLMITKSQLLASENETQETLQKLKAMIPTLVSNQKGVDTLKGASLTATVSELNQELAGTKLRLKTYESSEAKLSGEIQTLKQKLSQAESRESSIKKLKATDEDEVKSLLQKLNDSEKTYLQNTSNLQSEIASKEAEATAAQVESSRKDRLVRELKATVSQKEAQVQSATSALATSKSDSKKLREQLHEINNECDNLLEQKGSLEIQLISADQERDDFCILKNEYAASKKQHAKVISQLDSTQQRIQELYHNLTTKEREADNLQEALENHESHSVELQEEITNLEERLNTALEAGELNEVLQAKTKALEANIFDKTNQITHLIKRTEDLQESLTGKEAIVLTIETNIERHESLNGQLTNELEELREKLNTVNERHEEQLSHLDSEKTQRINALEQVLSEMQTHETELTEKTVSLKESNQRVSDLESKITQIEQQLTDKTKSFDVQISENEERQKEIDELRSQVIELQSNDSLEKQLTDLTSRIEVLKEAGSEKDDKISHLDSLQVSLGELNTGLNEELERKCEEIDNLNEKIVSLTTITTDTANVEEVNEKLAEKTSELEFIKQLLSQTEVQSSDKTIKIQSMELQFSTESKELRDCINQLEVNLTEKADEVIALEDKLSVLQDSKDSSNLEEGDLRKQLEERTETVSSLEQRITDLNDQVERLESNITIKADKITSIEQQFDELQTAKNKSDSEEIELRVQVTDLKQQVVELRDLKNESNSEDGELLDQVEQLKAEVSEKTDTIKDIKEQLEGLNSQVTNKETSPNTGDLEALRSQLTSLRFDCAAKDQQLTDIEIINNHLREKVAKSEYSNDDVEELIREHACTKEKLSTADDEILRLQSELTAKTHQIQLFQLDKDSPVSGSPRSQVSDAEHRLRQELDECQQAMQLEAAHIQKLTDDNKLHKEASQKARQDSQSFETELQTLRDDQNTKKQQIEELEAEVARNAAALSATPDSDSQIEELASELQLLREKLKEKNNLITTLEEQTSTTPNNEHLLQERIGSLEDEINNLNSAKDESESTLQEEIKQLEHELRQQTTSSDELQSRLSKEQIVINTLEGKVDHLEQDLSIKTEEKRLDTETFEKTIEDLTLNIKELYVKNSFFFKT